MTDVLAPVLYGLAHAAFGAIALMAMAYVVMLAGKLEERDLAAEASTKPDVVATFEASGGAAVIPHYVYVYGDKDAKDLSSRLHSIVRTRLTFAYVACLLIAFLMHSADLRDFVGIEDLAIVRNVASTMGIPASLVAPFGFTAYVVVELWLATRKYLKVLRQSR